ncbi:MAG: hypothetical protein H0T51_17835 [Pirellulales bacterium]|nr:hypothetical protein [Pirellulales bacterium]
MRLTLRTLLAYMDDILDPADQEELSRKIESSPFATELIHRSRDAVRRLRLSAPDPMSGSDDDIHGGDHNLDANTASEYLDNTLSPEAVADFERSCLEAGVNADMLLAEAASCHHVLTMVLGEPAEVDADLRQRMYALAQSPAAAPQQLRVEPAHKSAKQQPAVAAAAATPAAAARKSHVDADEAGVPDYILAAARERRRGQRTLLTVLGLAALLGGVATWLVMTSGESTPPDEIAQIGGIDEIAEGPTVSGAEGPTTSSATADSTTVAPGDANSEAPAFVAETPAGTTTEPAIVEAETVVPPTLNVPTLQMPPLDASEAKTQAEAALQLTLPPEAPTVEAVAAATPAAPTETTVADASAAATDAPPVDAAATAAATPAAPVVNEPPMVDAAAGDAPPSDAATAAASSIPQTPPAPSPTPGDAAAVGGAVGPIAAATTTTPAGDAPMIDPAAGTAPADASAVADAAAAAPKAIGAYLGNNDTLLKLDSEANVWVRLPPRTGFTGGEQLLVLPTFRTHVVLADVNAYLAGGTQIDLIPPTQSPDQPVADLAMHIPYGQVVLNSGLNGNRIELSMVDQRREVQLGPSSSLAVEVRRVFEPGGATKREPAPAEVTWYLTSGTATWGDSGSAEAPATWTTVGGEDSAPAAVEELPDWVDHEPINDNERRARERVSQALLAGEPVNTHLLELSDPTDRGRRTEDRALAARSGAYVGMFDALVTSLGDVNQRAAWRSQIDALRQAIARDPTAVEGIRAAFEIERGQEAADDLMEMLLGFDRAAVGTSRKEVQEGALVRLLRWMDDDDLTYRVLAWHNANEILGTRDVGGYKPEQSASQRKRMLSRLWERLERGELMPPEVTPNE